MNQEVPELRGVQVRNDFIALDTAEERSLTVSGTTEPLREWKAVWNVDKGKVAAIVSKAYTIVQHRNVAESFIQACQRLNINFRYRIRDGGNRFFMDVEFPDSRMKVSEGEEFIAGFRLGNSYNKTGSVLVMPRLVRLACNNGMVMPSRGFVPVFRVRHNQKLVTTFEGYIEKALGQVISSNDKLKSMVSECMKDSIEWETTKKLMEVLFKHEKHRLKVFEPLYEQHVSGKPITRWDVYNAVTRYATHGEQLSPHVEMMLQNRAKQLLVTPAVRIASQQ